jgi:hypothetical protein
MRSAEQNEELTSEQFLPMRRTSGLLAAHGIVLDCRQHKVQIRLSPLDGFLAANWRRGARP